MDQGLLAAIGHNLTAPMPLFFALGILATLIRSDLKVPEALYIGLTLYLLAAIGLRGGPKLERSASPRSGYHCSVVSCWAFSFRLAVISSFVI